MGKVILDESKCIGCGACCSLASENFTYNDEGRASLINEKITDAAIEASETCPTSAIQIENDTKEKCKCEEHCNCNDDCCCDCGNECNCTEENNCGCKN